MYIINYISNILAKGKNLNLMAKIKEIDID